MTHLGLENLPCESPSIPGQGASKTPRNTVIYAIGDIHGRLDMLRAIQQGIVEDAARREATRRELIFLGDYISRGPDSRGVIDFLIGSPPDGFSVHHLMGNHEEFLLRFLRGDLAAGAHWLGYGGIEGFASFGIKASAEDILDHARLEGVRRLLMDKLSGERLSFLMNLEIFRRRGDYFFVHAGVNPDVPLAEQDEQDLIWIRDRFLESDVDFGATVVHGHTIAAAPVVKPNRIGIDTGAGKNMALTCLILEGADRQFLCVRNSCP